LATLRVTTGEVGPLRSPFTADEAQARASLDRLLGLGLEAPWVLPGHGEPWTGDLAFFRSPTAQPAMPGGRAHWLLARSAPAARPRRRLGHGTIVRGPAVRRLTPT
jgi:glyoxylase-like metal-dependent hydrolase (beta-lactamase superfamily II)